MKRTAFATVSSMTLAAALIVGCASDDYTASNSDYENNVGYASNTDYERDYDDGTNVTIKDTSGGERQNPDRIASPEYAEDSGEVVEEGVEEVGQAAEFAYDETADAAEELWPDRGWENWAEGEEVEESFSTDEYNPNNEREPDVAIEFNNNQATQRQTAARTGQSGEIGSRWDQWEQNVADQTVSIKNNVQREIDAIDNEIKNVLNEQAQLRQQNAETLYELEQQRAQLERQLDQLYAQGDAAMNQIQGQITRTAQNVPNPNRQQSAQQGQINQRGIVTDQPDQGTLYIYESDVLNDQQQQNTQGIQTGEFGTQNNEFNETQEFEEGTEAEFQNQNDEFENQ